MGRGSADFVHTVLECAKLAFADREAWYGDPSFADVPLETLLQRRVRGRARARSWATRPRASCGPGAGRALAAAADRRPSATEPAARRGGLGRADRAATRATSTSSTASATWSRPRRAAAGCRARRSSRGSASRSARARRCSGSRRACRTRSRRASARARRSRRRSRSATASRTSRSARRAATSRTSGRCSSSCRHVHFGLNLQAAIDAPPFHTNHFPSSFYPREAQAAADVEIEARFGEAVVGRAPTSADTRSRSTADWSLGRRERRVAATPDGTLRPPRTRAACRATRSGADWVESLTRGRQEFGLGRMRALLDALGDPQRRVPVASTSSGRTASRPRRGPSRRTCASVRSVGRRLPLAARARAGASGSASTVARPTSSGRSTRVRAAAVAVGATQFEVLTAAAFAEFASVGRRRRGRRGRARRAARRDERPRRARSCS